MTDRARELAEALSRSPWIDTHVADVCRRLLQKWIDEDRANPQETMREHAMNDVEKRVWQAIEGALRREGDGDLRAGLAWITDEQAQLIARAAIEAITPRGQGAATPPASHDRD